MSISPHYAASHLPQPPGDLSTRLKRATDTSATQAPKFEPNATTSPHEAELLTAYIDAVQRKVLHNDAGVIKVPPQSTLGKWLELYRDHIEHPVMQRWMSDQKINQATPVYVDPFKGTLSAEVGGEMKTFSLSDTTGWGQVSGPLLAAAKVIAPEDKGPLRVRFRDGFNQVSAKVVANFQGIPLPSRRSQASEQIKHLEHQKAFDPIPTDDRLRKAGSRSTHALEAQKQNAARFYSTAPQALEFKRLAVDVADDLPNTRAEAKKWAEKLIFELTGKQVDADTIYLNRFKGANTPLSNDTATVTGWEHRNEEPFSSLRLPDALLKNFNEHDGIPGNLDLEAGLYLDGPGQGTKGGYGAHNQFPLAPSTLMHTSWKTNFQAQMTQKIDKFWVTHAESYETAIKGEFVYQARKQFKAYEAKSPAERALLAPEHKFTHEDYRLVMGAVSNLPVDENAPLSVEQLKAKAPVKGIVETHAFNIHGFTSNDMVRFSAPDGRQVLSMPGAEPVFLRFDSLEKLDQWVIEQTKNPRKREALLSHFPLIYRQDQEAGFAAKVGKALMPILWFTHVGDKTEGLNTYFDKMAKGELQSPGIKDGASKIEGDVFNTLATATKERMSSDADTVIKSNSEVIRDTWLNDITVAASLLVKLAPIAAPVAVVAFITSVTEMVLGEEKASSGDTEAERKDGASKAFDGLLNALFSVGAGARPEDPFAITPEEELTPLERPVQPERPQIDEPQPGPSRGGRTINEPAQPPLPRSPSLIPMARYAVPDGEALIEHATRDAQGVYRMTDNAGAWRQFIRCTDETGKSKIFEISGQYRSGNRWAKIIDPNNGRGIGVVTPGRDGEWTRAPGDGGGWWTRASSPSPSTKPTAPPQISDEFLELSGSKMKGAETLDKYFNLDESQPYSYGVNLNDEGEIIPQISWEAEENPATATLPPKADTAGFGANDYSGQFISDLNRSRLTIQKPDGSTLEIDVGADLRALQRTKKGALASEEEIKAIKQKNIEALERFMPDPALRARVSEVANQWIFGPIPEEFRTSRFKDEIYIRGGNQHYVVDYDPAKEITTVTGKTDFDLFRINENTRDIEPITDLHTKSSRSVTFRPSNEIDSDGYVMDKSAPIRVEITPKPGG